MEPQNAPGGLFNHGGSRIAWAILDLVPHKVGDGVRAPAKSEIDGTMLVGTDPSTHQLSGNVAELHNGYTRKILRFGQQR